MASSTESRINVRLDSDLKRTIQDAAVALGQTVSEFAISTMLREARQVLADAEVTRLSNRDRAVFLELLDGDHEPNEALVNAAKRYRDRVGRHE